MLIELFTKLGSLFGHLANNDTWEDYSWGVTSEEYEKLRYTVNRQFVYNGWFTKESVERALLSWSEVLTEDKLQEWSDAYQQVKSPKRIAVIMAGNIPLVGFHDFLTVLLSGHRVIGKLSSDDQTLLPSFVEILYKWEPSLKEWIVLTPAKLPEFDAVIATGSNNSMQHFEQYFGKYPHIFRKNRTSVAVFNGEETKEEIEALGEDIFAYYGLGCRNVTHLLLPEGFNLDRFFEGIFKYNEVIYHKKYGNNYDYHKAVYLMNKISLLDNNFVLLRESEELHSPISLIHYHYYKTSTDKEAFLQAHGSQIQAIVGHGYIPFGEAQKPSLSDYADGIDTFAWLTSL
ncbi:MAG: acyl-CoA reductase [Crocinitomicaceae bacterium]|nr:acyl-CoA reductase [Crocinitomicaceae bacterium]